MRKLMAIGMALCIFAVLVSSASACIPGPDNNYCKPVIVKPPSIEPAKGFAGYDSVDYGGHTSGDATSFGGCTNFAQVATEAGQNSATSGYSITNAYAAGDGLNYAGAAGGSGFHN